MGISKLFNRIFKRGEKQHKQHKAQKSVDAIRASALLYVSLMDRQMKDDHTPRHVRRRFWRELVKDGRFYEGDKAEVCTTVSS